MTDMENTGTSGSSSVKRSWYIKAFLTLLIATLLSAAMLYFTKMIPEIGKWYSFDQSLRLQTEAFMRGMLAIQPVPYGHRHDWIWANGMHQSWGLGVPFLQLPFQIVGKIFGSFGFPDRIIFLICYFCVSVLLWKSLDVPINTDRHSRDRLVKRIQLMPVLFFAMLNPAFITMMRAKFGPYEEVIAYAYLWSFMLFALLYIFLNSRQSSIYFLLSFLAGFSVTLRPTAGAYGTVTFLIAFYLAGRSMTRHRWIGLPLFLTGNLFFIVTNYLRFGSPFEFGPNMSLTGSNFSDYIVSFDNPVKWYPFMTSAIELISGLFFIDFERLYLLDNGLLWQSNKLRWLELNFKPFDVATLVLLFFGWVIVVFAWRFKKKECSSSDSESREIVRSLGLWSILSFLMLFLFYSRWPGILSRYLVDFGPAIVVGIVILYWFLSDLARDKFSPKMSSRLNIMLSLLFLGWIFFSLSNAAIAPLYGHLSKVELTNVTNAEVARNKLIQMKRTQGLALPIEYRCGDIESKYEIMYNNANWDISNSCVVNLVTTHFLDSPRCLKINLEPLDGVPAPIFASYLEDIEVNVGIERFRRTSDIPNGLGRTITFCSGGKHGYENLDYVRYKVIKIKWANIRKHNNTSPPFRLLSLKKVNQEP